MVYQLLSLSWCTAEKLHFVIVVDVSWTECALDLRTCSYTRGSASKCFPGSMCRLPPLHPEAKIERVCCTAPPPPDAI